MEDIGLPELTDDQIEALCLTAENAARNHILSKILSKMVEILNISTEVDGINPVNLTVDVEIAPVSQIKNLDLNKLADEAAKEALKVSEKYLRQLT